MLDVTDAVLTGDANQCNKKVAQGILDAGAGYVLCLKPNREAMYRAVDGAFARLNVNEFPEVKVRHHRECNEGHGRTEVRQLCSDDELDEYAGDGRPGLPLRGDARQRGPCELRQLHEPTD